jgi:hypothetical protein
MPKHWCRTLLALGLLGSFGSLNAETQIPESSFAILDNYCLSCHDDVEFKGEINLDQLKVDWSNSDAVDLWRRVIKVVQNDEMPPKKKKQPTQDERKELATWLDTMLSEYSPIGGTKLRRLNRREYKHSIDELFGINYELPNGFPKDNKSHGFDNQAEALTLSGPLLEAYSNVATDLAEKLFPPERKAVEPETYNIPGSDFTFAYSSGLVVDGIMRLVSNTPQVAHSASWPTHFEAPTTGIFQVTIDLSSFNTPEGVSAVADLYAVEALDAASNNVGSLRKLGSFHVLDSSGQRFSINALLEKGETLAFHYANGMISEEPERLRGFIQSLLSKDPILASGFKQAGGKVTRGRIGLEDVYAFIDANELPPAPVGEELDELITKMSQDKRSITETLSYKMFEEGPALEIRHVSVFGPTSLENSQEDFYWKEKATELAGTKNSPSQFIQRFLSKAFRRPAEKHVIQEYLAIVQSETSRTGRIEDGYHLAVRTALKSPYFLYRGFSDGALDNYELASRLAYFLTSRPPDTKLQRAAASGAILNPEVLTQHTRRLLGTNKSNSFIESFLGQWLGLDELENLVPDANLFESPRTFKYTDAEKDAYVQEAHMVFREILDDNRPIEDFIDPDFTYTTGAVAKFIYDLPEFKTSSKNDNKTMQRISLERGGRFGGVLGMAGIMTATANGVDTQPVLRGVWALENILGSPPPPPPDAVPALTPDTTKAESPREMFAAHMGEESCAGCHKKIDPIGFVLESFDPIGRWRTEYPPVRTSSTKKTEISIPVETNGKLTDGTVLKDITDLKAYLRNDISPFAECISEKLLTYATGRSMSYSDHKLIKHTVTEIREQRGGFQDLVIALVNSDSFRTK